ncbi:tRNA (guanosine(37)-N1)-methyltransferase TrmD [Marinicellulosiphila megalodicopiae]|uniref:tRNA (guanosine(37)-N1)-methyltransferase TrmD n=1 Tax=Marinicellulosiphila megalodicopiae TaxID=2724896 RepID=UPI003BB1BBB5
MWFGVITLFESMFDGFCNEGVVGRAIQSDLLKVDFFNPRDFTTDAHNTVDDRPFGGGPGMLMKVEPLQKAIEAAKLQIGSDAKVIYLSPQGQPLAQKGVEKLAQTDKLIFICGRYEGIDERVITQFVDEQWSLGDFVLSGGEVAAMAFMDAISRQVPGVLGKQSSVLEDSFVEGLLDCPHYTRPEELNGQTVPKVLLSGHHENIRKWRLKQSLGNTWVNRPDLLEKLTLTPEQLILLDEFKCDFLTLNRAEQELS